MSKPILPPDLLRKLADFERRIQAMERRPDTPFREVPAGEVSGTIDVPLLHTDGNVLIVATLTGDTTFNIQGLRSDVYFTFLLTQDEVGGWSVDFSPTPTTPRNDPLPMGTLPGDLNYIIGVGTDETHFFAFLGGGPILPQSGHRIYDELDPVFQREKLSFRGEGVMVFDEPGSLSTVVQVASASGGASGGSGHVIIDSTTLSAMPSRGSFLINGFAAIDIPPDPSYPVPIDTLGATLIMPPGAGGSATANFFDVGDGSQFSTSSAGLFIAATMICNDIPESGGTGRLLRTGVVYMVINAEVGADLHQCGYLVHGVDDAYGYWPNGFAVGTVASLTDGTFEAVKLIQPNRDEHISIQGPHSVSPGTFYQVEVQIPFLFRP